MRRMFSENQIKKMIEECLSNASYQVVADIEDNIDGWQWNGSVILQNLKETFTIECHSENAYNDGQYPFRAFSIVYNDGEYSLAEAESCSIRAINLVSGQVIEILEI